MSRNSANGDLVKRRRCDGRARHRGGRTEPRDSGRIASLRRQALSSPRAAARLCAAGAVLALVSGCSGGAAGVKSGPLDFPSGLTAMMYPMETGSFYVVGACAKQEAVSVQIVQVEPVDLSGADRVRFKVGWPTPKHPNRFGSAPIRRLPDLFEAAQGSSGTAKSCDDPPSSLQIATVFPAAVHRDIVVDGIEVTYEVDGRRYTGTADVRLGVCAAEPAGEPSEPCR